MPVVNPVHAASELKNFMEAFDDGINFRNKKLKKSAKGLGSESNLNEAKIFTGTTKPASIDVYKQLAADDLLKQFPNIATLFKGLLLIPST